MTAAQHQRTPEFWDALRHGYRFEPPHCLVLEDGQFRRMLAAKKAGICWEQLSQRLCWKVSIDGQRCLEVSSELQVPFELPWARGEHSTGQPWSVSYTLAAS